MFRNNEPFFQLRFWLITVVLFALAFLWCGYYNRPASDDFEFLRMLRNEGWNDSALVFRYTWNTRWISILWLNTWLLIYENTGSLLPYHVCTLAALWLSTRYFITAF